MEASVPLGALGVTSGVLARTPHLATCPRGGFEPLPPARAYKWKEHSLWRQRGAHGHFLTEIERMAVSHTFVCFDELTTDERDTVQRFNRILRLRTYRAGVGGRKVTVEVVLARYSVELYLTCLTSVLGHTPHTVPVLIG